MGRAAGDAASRSPLLVGVSGINTPPARAPPSPYRWGVLLAYSYTAALQSLLWMSFSSTPQHARDYLQVGEGTLQLFLNEGPIAFLCVVFFASWLLQRRHGLQLSVQLAAALCAVASLIRLVPCWLTPEQRTQAHVPMLVSVHLGQIINAGVAPLVVASPSYLSLVWFPESERNLATAIANVASAVGRAVGFFLGPALVHTAEDMKTLLLVEAALAVLPAVVILWYLPAQPTEPPSIAAAAGRDPAAVARRTDRSVVTSLKMLLADFAGACTSAPFVLLALAGGLQMGVYGAWSGVLPQVLSDRFSDTQCGTLGSVNTFAGIAGGLIAGRVTDWPILNRRLKTLVIACALMAGVFFFLFALALPPYKAPALAHWSFATFLTMCGLAGLFRGATDPLFFELSAELTHPRPAGISGSVLTFFYHLLLVASLSVPSHILNKWTTTIMYSSMALCALLLLPIRPRYVRRLET